MLAKDEYVREFAGVLFPGRKCCDGCRDLLRVRGIGYAPAASSQQIGIDDVVMEADGLARRVRVFRLPDDNPCREMNEVVELDLCPGGDNPIWVSVFTEDGFQAWSSPIFVFR